MTIRFALLVVLAAASAAVAYEAVDVKDGGTVTGEVKFAGAPLPRKKVAVTKDQETCGTEKDSQEIRMTADGKVEGAVVYLADVKRGKALAAAEPAVLDQKACEYRPRVVMTPAGSPLRILNSDGILHNIHTYSRKNPPVNIAQPKFKKEVTAKFDAPELVAVKCDAHEWMHGTVVVEDHPYYAATDGGGAFRLADVPPGEYTVRAWHPRLGETEQKVRVEASKEARVDLTLGPK
jgi:plastocyanin